MATTADIKIGMCIELDGKTFQLSLIHISEPTRPY